MPAFASAIDRGADGIELDVHMSADGEVVVHHFYTLGATDNGTGLVHEHTQAQLKALDSGGWFDAQFAGVSMPTLSEVLCRFSGRARFEVDMKGSSLGFLRTVIAVIETLVPISDVELTTAHYPLLIHARRLRPQMTIGAFFHQPPVWMPAPLAQEHALDWSEQLGIDVVHLNASLLTRPFVDRLHERGSTVHGSNLDTVAGIERGLEMGIDVMSTGHLGLALSLRDKFVTICR